MNYLDLIIIYLACGSPFGVYYFFNNRQPGHNTRLKSIIILFFWIPYAVKLLQSSITEKLNNKSLISDQEKILLLQKDFEKFLQTKNTELSLFELREVLERYTELTLINSNTNGVPAQHEYELYRLEGSEKAEISALCLNRRNHKRLQSHQSKARIDFIKSLKMLINANSDNKQLFGHSLEFVKLLKDDETQTLIKDLFDDSWQSNNEPYVTYLEKETWKPLEQKLSNEKQISMPLQAMKLTPTVHKKD